MKKINKLKKEIMKVQIGKGPKKIEDINISTEQLIDKINELTSIVNELIEKNKKFNGIDLK